MGDIGEMKVKRFQSIIGLIDCTKQANEWMAAQQIEKSRIISVAPGLYIHNGKDVTEIAVFFWA